MVRSAIAAVLLLTALPCLAAGPGAFRFLKDAQRPDAGKENLLAITLDSDIYAATREGLPDFRIFDRKDQEVPYLLEKVTEGRSQMVRETSASAVASLHEQDNAIEVLVRLGTDAPPADGLTVHTPLVDYERRLSVSGSEDGKKWTPLVDNGLLFDYTRFMDVRNSEIRLPKNRCRQLKIVIDAISDTQQSPLMELTRKLKNNVERERIERNVLERRPLRIDRLELWHEAQREVGRQDKHVEYPIVDFRAEEDPKEKTTLVHVRTGRQPLTELAIETTSRNFQRAVVVEKPVTHGVRTEWVTVAQGQLRLIDFHGFHNEGMAISFPEQREEEYRLVIRNEDSPPLAIAGVKAHGSVYRALFLAGADETYRVFYASDQVKPPKYDAAAVLLLLQQEQGGDALAATPGPQVANPAAGAAAGEPAFHRLLNNPLALGGVAVVLAVILAWALFRAMRRINQLPKEPEA